MFPNNPFETRSAAMLQSQSMRWSQNVRHPVYEYQLLNGDRVVQQMTFDYRKSTYTAHCQTDSGGFVIDREGFFKTKLVIKENDRVIGRFFPKNWWSTAGVAKIAGEEIEYRIGNNPLVDIRFLYKDNLLIACGIKPDKGNNSVEIQTATHFDKHPLAKYLLALSWYLIQPALSVDTVAFAV